MTNMTGDVLLLIAFLGCLGILCNLLLYSALYKLATDHERYSRPLVLAYGLALLAFLNAIFWLGTGGVQWPVALWSAVTFLYLLWLILAPDQARRVFRRGRQSA
ncbi:MAG: hypothetical protein U0232_01250 [Thermomicrobiales bacterium]